MIILAVKGAADKGKNTAIKKAHNLLSKKGKKYIEHNDLSPINNNDFKALVVLTCKITIAFYSAGDDEDAIKNAFQYAEDGHADILIMPVRTKGATSKVLNAIVKSKQHTLLTMKPVDVLNNNYSCEINKDCRLSWLSEDCIDLAEMTAVNILITLKYVIAQIRVECNVEIFI